MRDGRYEREGSCGREGRVVATTRRSPHKVQGLMMVYNV